MAKTMLIDAAHPEETRVVVVDGNRIEDFDFEAQNKKQLRGNIYLAKITRVEPSLQAAFVEYGGNRHGFLAFSEIHPDYYMIPTADRQALIAEIEAASRRHHGDTDADGDHESDGDDDENAEDEIRRRILSRRYKIQEVIRRRQIMLVQVVKEERGTKGAALTTYMSLAGRYCVLMPNTARGGGISRKITNGADRKRLKKVATELEVPDGMGVIVRTAGAKRTKTEIKRDYEYLMRAWENIRDKTLKSMAPALIYEESSLVKRAVRDLYDKDVDTILVEGEGAYKEAKDFIRMLMPSHAKKVIHYKEPSPVLVRHGVERQLESIYSPIVQLKSGGYIVINQTEALVAIDVNSGRSTREKNIEQTALRTNLEAAEEAARQMRLRDLAGLIVIDFIDMEDAKNDRSVEKRMKDCLRFDRARVQMGKISGFGLLEMSRQRRRTGVLEGSSHICQHCSGSGRIRSPESRALKLLRVIDEEAVKRGGAEIEARAQTEVALYVLNEKREALGMIEQARGVRIRVLASDEPMASDFEINSLGQRGEMDGEGEDIVFERPERPEKQERPDRSDRQDRGREQERGRGRSRGARRADPEVRDDEDIIDDEAEVETTVEANGADDESGEGGRRSRRRGRNRRGGKRRRDETGGGSGAGPSAWADGEEGDEDGADTSEARADGGEPRAERGERDRGDRDRNRRRRRRRGRGRRSFVAADGGEFLDLLATDPVLTPSQQAEADREDEDEDEGRDADASLDAAPAPAAPAPKPARAPRTRRQPRPAAALAESEDQADGLATPAPLSQLVEEADAPSPDAPIAAAPAPDNTPASPEAALPAADETAVPVAAEADYEPDLERRQKFFARFNRWGKKG
jgi:ribonuclease E